MKPVPLPYLARPDIEQRLADFLHARLEPAPNTPKALIVHGPPGVGKRTLLRHVFASDARFNQYKITDPDTREALEGKAPARRKQFLEKAAEVLGHVAGLAQPLVGLSYGLAHTLGKDHHLRDKTLVRQPRDAARFILTHTTTPVLLVVADLDPHDHDALDAFGHLINEGYRCDLPLALIFLDATTTPGESVVETHLRCFLHLDECLDALAVAPFSAETLHHQALHGLGLPPTWTRACYQFSEGFPARLAWFWETAQSRRMIERAGKDRWQALQPAVELVEQQGLVRELLYDLILPPRTPEDTPFRDELVTALLWASAMGKTFLPQAVAECALAVSPRRDAFDPDAWEDLWYDIQVLAGSERE